MTFTPPEKEALERFGFPTDLVTGEPRTLTDEAREEAEHLRGYNDALAGLLVRLADALDNRLDGLRDVIDDAQRKWHGSGRHEPLAAAIDRSVTTHMKGGET